MVPWVERRFAFDEPAELWPVVLERVRGTPARTEERVRGLPRELRVRRDGERWSVQEHVGHLIDLDVLHEGRLDDYRAGVPMLRAADMTNRRTWEADHNAREMEDLLRDLREARGRLVARLEAWEPEAWGLSAIHPRLGRPMRVVDLARFVAEHDDHHLARITELRRKWGPGTA